MVEATIIDEARQEWMMAPRGLKTRVVERWAELAGCSAKTLYAQLGTGRQRRSGDRRIENVEHYALLVHQVKKRPPEGFSEISTDQAIKIAIGKGLVPSFMKGKVSTVNRIGRELGMGRRQRRVQRFQAERPNELHHVDASSSRHFYIARETGDGDYILKIHAGTKGYKNKPVPIRLRPWLYGLTDDHSGVFVAKYFPAYGESALDNLVFLDWAWRQKRDESLEFFGIPERLKADHGPLMKSSFTNDFLDRLGITIDGSEPGKKEAHGKIERPWRTVWQRFELPFFAESNWRKFEISLSDLNSRFMRFLAECNDKRHRYERKVSRNQVWRRIAHQGGAITIPDDALGTVASRLSRKVGADGCFSIDNVVYEVLGLHDAWVWVYRGLFDGRMVAEHQETHEKYEVIDFRPNTTGQYTSHPPTPHQVAKAASDDLELENNLYTGKEKSPGNVVQIPTKVKKTVEVYDHLDVSTYPCMNEAIQAFISMSGVVPDKEDREGIEELIRLNNLSRRFVSDLAGEVQVEKRRIS